MSHERGQEEGEEVRGGVCGTVQGARGVIETEMRKKGVDGTTLGVMFARAHALFRIRRRKRKMEDFLVCVYFFLSLPRTRYHEESHTLQRLGTLCHTCELRRRC